MRFLAVSFLVGWFMGRVFERALEHGTRRREVATALGYFRGIVGAPPPGADG